MFQNAVRHKVKVYFVLSKKNHIDTVLKCRAKHLQYKLYKVRCVVKNIARVSLNVCPSKFRFPDERDLKMAEGIRGFNQRHLPLGCGSIDACNNFCPFQVRRQLAEWRFLKHSAIHRRRPLLQLPEFLPEDHPLSDTDCVQADESMLCVRSQYRKFGDIQGVSLYRFDISRHIYINNCSTIRYNDMFLYHFFQIRIHLCVCVCVCIYVCCNFIIFPESLYI